MKRLSEKQSKDMARSAKLKVSTVRDKKDRNAKAKRNKNLAEAIQQLKK
jgi:hypothetical protein